MKPEALLVELLTEELPPKALLGLSLAFAQGLVDGLRERQFLGDDPTSAHFATPRRLAVLIEGVSQRSPDTNERVRILPVSVALDAKGQPSATLQKKLASLHLEGLGPADLERASDGKGEAFFYRRSIAGVMLGECLAQLLPEVISRLPIPKVMNYQVDPGGDGETTVAFVRPAHALTVVHGKTVVPASVLGLHSGRQTQGHRFMSSGPVEIATAADYASLLQQHGRVIAGFEERRDAIHAALMHVAGQDRILAPAALLDEVTALVEWPVVYLGRFEEQYLKLPQECLILTMQRHQRYFALTDAGGRMVNRFLVVANIDAADPSGIISGHERVLRARLADAQFFFEQDAETPLRSRVDALDSVVYHHRLGSLGDRARRLASLAGTIAERLALNASWAREAALTAKCDLVTDMVGEFPELQGTMGEYYARRGGQIAEIAQAIGEHYRPRFAKDSLPVTPTGTCVALADKLEALAGLFGIGSVPTGDSDPYALRRQALGVLRILSEGQWPLRLSELLRESIATFSGFPKLTDPYDELRAFLHERLRGLLRDQGYSSAEVESVLSLGPDRIDLVVKQLDAVRAFLTLPEADSLAAANKRIGNILKKSGAEAGALDPGLLSEDAERALGAALGTVRPVAEAQFADGDYTAMLASLAALRVPVDTFFDQVMVMAEDERLRRNRLALLGEVHGLMNRVADLSKLAA